MIYEREFVNGIYSVKYNEDIIKGEDKSRLNFVISDIDTNDKILLMTEMNRNKKNY